MEIKKTLETKYGQIEVTFILDDGVWIASTDSENINAVVEEETYDEAEKMIIELFEVGFEYHERFENNEHKNKVDYEILKDLFDYDKMMILRN